MSEQKTEKPTQKKIRDARKKGQVFRSRDLTQAFLFLTAVGVLAIGGPSYVSELRKLMTDFFQPGMLTGQLRSSEVLQRMGYGWARALLLSTPLLAAVTVVAAAINFLQVQPLFAPEAVKPKLEHLNPVKGIQNIFFKSRTYLELVKNLVKFVAVMALAYAVAKASLRDIVLTARADPLLAAQLAGDLMISLLLKIGVAFLVLGAADYLMQKMLYLKNLKMSKYEVKKEYKEEEGDPLVKHKRARLRQELLAHSVMQSVPKAVAVVVNPTHLAIALEYDEAWMNAPVVSAKGQESMATRIIAVAKEHHIPVVRNVPLAHSLYEIDIGTQIPEALYEAVAEVLNWVYEMAQMEEA